MIRAAWMRLALNSEKVGVMFLVYQRQNKREPPKQLSVKLIFRLDSGLNPGLPCQEVTGPNQARASHAKKDDLGACTRSTAARAAASACGNSTDVAAITLPKSVA